LEDIVVRAYLDIQVLIVNTTLMTASTINAHLILPVSTAIILTIVNVMTGLLENIAKYWQDHVKLVFALMEENA